MIHGIFKQLDAICQFSSVQAHCDIPCKIYDPQIAQIAALSVIRFMDLIQELADKDSLTLAEQAQLGRLMQEKKPMRQKLRKRCGLSGVTTSNSRSLIGSRIPMSWCTALC